MYVSELDPIVSYLESHAEASDQPLPEFLDMEPGESLPIDATIAFDPRGNTNPDNVLVVDLSGQEGFVGTRQGARDTGYWHDFDMPAAA